MPAAPAPILLPTPRSIEMGEGFAEVSPDLHDRVARLLTDAAALGQNAAIGPDVAFGDPNRPGMGGGGEKSYRIDIAPPTARGQPPITITAQGVPLRRAALQTLGQLLRVYGSRIPTMRIEDGPGFAVRGVMLDVSRDKVPTMAQLRATIDLLGSLKFNHLQLYTEHTFAYPGHEDVWKDWSPITPSEARELDAYAAARGIELAANQNCFGHLSAWLKKPAYQHLAEIEGDGAWYFHQWERRGPFSLCPVEPRAEEFVGELLAELLPCFESKLVNIGCDETFDVGWGRSKQEIERRVQDAEGEAAEPSGPRDTARSRARAELYFEFVAKIARCCEKHGKRPMMWADIALTHPELLHLMPKDMIGLAWWYEPTPRFEKWVHALREAGHEAWVCPGTSSWRTFTGRTTERRANIADAAEQGMRAGATGFLVCDWGDMGHRQQWPLSLIGIAQAAEAAWNPDRARDFDPRAGAIHALGENGALGPWLDELGDCDLPIRRAGKIANASALFNDLHPPVPGQLRAGAHEVEATVEEWRATRERIEHLAASRPPIADGLIREELDHAIECALFAADHAIAARTAGTPTLRVRSGSPPSEPSATRSVAVPLIARAEHIRAEHERLWLKRNRSGGMAHASTFYTRVIDALRSAAS